MLMFTVWWLLALDREISEPNINKNAGPDYLHSSSRIANEGNSNYDSAENQDTTMHGKHGYL